MSNEGATTKRKADGPSSPKKRPRMTFSKTIEVIAVDKNQEPLRTFVIYEDDAEEMGTIWWHARAGGPLCYELNPDAIEIYLNWFYDKDLEIEKYAFVQPSEIQLKRHLELPEHRERASLLVGRIAGLLDLWVVGEEFEDCVFQDMIMDLVCEEELDQERDNLLHLLADVLRDSLADRFWDFHSYDQSHEPMRWLIDLLANSLSGAGLRAIICSDRLGEEDFTKALTDRIMEGRKGTPIISWDYHH
ncbi:hypothetical protein AC578_9755 [Pseudocercospora eumusae]|uniref:Uncharacterized protein n=1 Tax=Pseudocercospora eumusae TaxID=321146 RepID=A0A139HQR0_9PEZI|nr:hypothetical protein AC578_9755 [Pseudocercospora eumusae]